MALLEVERCPNVNEFPSVVRGWKELRYLSFSGTSLTRLPDWIGKMVELTDLVVIKSKLQVLPDGIADLMYLERLRIYLNDGPLSIPASLGQLTRLQQFDHSPFEVRNGQETRLRAQLPQVAFRRIG